VFRKFARQDRVCRHGVNCVGLRNEGHFPSSSLIRGAVSDWAWIRRPGERLYTYVDGHRVVSTNPGFCFKCAGWEDDGVMGDVRIRNLDEDVVLALKALARRHGNSLEGELRTMLTAAARRPRQELVAELERFQGELKAKYGDHTDSVPLIREERDRWG
jgi:plasmid stability protein